MNGDLDFSTEIPSHKAGDVVEYYISVVSGSGKEVTKPVTSSAGTYKFLIK